MAYERDFLYIIFHFALPCYFILHENEPNLHELPLSKTNFFVDSTEYCWCIATKPNIVRFFHNIIRFLIHFLALTINKIRNHFHSCHIS